MLGGYPLQTFWQPCLSRDPGLQLGHLSENLESSQDLVSLHLAFSHLRVTSPSCHLTWSMKRNTSIMSAPAHVLPGLLPLCFLDFSQFPHLASSFLFLLLSQHLPVKESSRAVFVCGVSLILPHTWSHWKWDHVPLYNSFFFLNGVYEKQTLTSLQNTCKLFIISPKVSDITRALPGTLLPSVHHGRNTDLTLLRVHRAIRSVANKKHHLHCSPKQRES